MKKTKIIKLSNEFVFLKKKIHITDRGKIYMKILPRSINTMKQKLKKLYKKMIEGTVSYEDIESAYQSWRSYALKYNSYGSIKSIDKLYHELYKNYLTKNIFWTYPIMEEK